MPKLPKFVKKNKVNLILGAAVLLVILGGVFVYKTVIAKSQVQDKPVVEKDLIFDPEGPYALLSPRRDGNALILDIKRTASYDAISYELSYVSQAENNQGEGEIGGVDRGVMGTINTKDKKSEYEQEILFGTCSKNVCKYDKGVENGTLVLHIKKGSEAYRMTILWHLQQPAIALGKLSSGDSHFNYQSNTKSADLSLVKYTIINDLSGAPKLPQDKNVIGKVYAVNAISGQTVPAGTVSIELAENPLTGSSIVRWDENKSSWVELKTDISGSKLTASAPGNGIFTVLVPSSN